MSLHAAPIEWVWVVVTAAGVIVNVSMFRSAVRMQVALLHSDMVPVTPAERIVAAANVRQEALRLGKQVMMLVGGTIAVFLPPPPPSLGYVPQTAVSASVIIGVSFLMTITSLNEQAAQRMISQLGLIGKEPKP